jgi:hypothetical protein
VTVEEKSTHMAYLTASYIKSRLLNNQVIVLPGSTSTGTGSTPTGGGAGQVLTKNSPADFDYSWKDATVTYSTLAKYGV